MAMMAICKTEGCNRLVVNPKASYCCIRCKNFSWARSILAEHPRHGVHCGEGFAPNPNKVPPGSDDLTKQKAQNRMRRTRKKPAMKKAMKRTKKKAQKAMKK